MNKLGPYESEFREVIKFVIEGPFLTGRKCPGDLKGFVRVVDEMYPDQIFLGPGLVEIEDGSGLMSYDEYQGRCEAAVRGDIYEISDSSMRRSLHKTMPKNSHLLIMANMPEEFHELAFKIEHDMSLIMMARAGSGVHPDRFWERVFRVYLAGGMPVGYDGDAEGSGRGTTILACFPGGYVPEDRLIPDPIYAQG